MKLVGTLKDKVDAAQSPDEKRKLIAEAGMELTDDELDAVSGGSSDSQEQSSHESYSAIPFDAIIGGPLRP